MHRMQEAFNRAHSQSRGALVVYLTAGFPTMDESEALMLQAARSGADIIEVVIPFSDPIADGPAIQAAGQTALQEGANLRDILRMIASLSAQTDTPIVIMSGYNPILAYDPERFAADASEAGVCGVLIADLPPAEGEAWCDAAAEHGLSTVFLVAPTTTPERFTRIVQCTTGFVYVLSRMGVTGERETLPPELPGLVRRVRECTSLPIAVGVGISNSEQVSAVCALADGVIVGSAVVRAAALHDAATSRLEAVRNTVAELAKACIR